MSEKNSEGKRTARERLIQEREAQKSRDKRRRVLIVGAAVVGVLGLAAVAGVVAANNDGGKGDKASGSGPVKDPAGTFGEGNVAIPVGMTDAPSVLTVYEDLRCPACGMFENTMRDTVNKLEREGKIRAEYHLVSFIDNAMQGTGSKYAANALGCAQDAGKFHAYHDVLFRNQPQETDDAFGKKSHLLDLAQKVPGLRGETFDACVDEGTHASWVTKVQEDFSNSKYKATPTVLLNGESIFPQKGSEQISPANLVKWVDVANRGKRVGKVPASASASAPAPGPGPASVSPSPTGGPGAAGVPGAAGTAGPAGPAGVRE